MSFIIRPAGTAGLNGAQIVSSGSLPQTVEGLTPGLYDVGRIAWAPSAVTVSAAVAPLDVSTLFSRGRKGFWLNVADRTQLFQDTAGATAVTASGQPVGRVRFSAGTSTAATRGTTASPTYQASGGRHWLQFAGNSRLDLNDGLGMAAGVGHFFIAAAVRFAALPSGTQRVLMISIGNSTGHHRASIRGMAGGRLDAGGRRLDSSSLVSFNVPTSVNDQVVVALFNYADATLTLRVNGVAVVNAQPFQTRGNTSATASASIAIGGTNGSSQFFSGRLYEMVAGDGMPTPSEIAGLEARLAASAGL
jgi:hypothetical protein